jgi:predicted RNase H-like HicB family nuclease
MEFAVVISRDPETGAVTASAPDFENVVYVGDPAESDEMVRQQFAKTLSNYLDYLSDKNIPIPAPRHRVTTVFA